MISNSDVKSSSTFLSSATSIDIRPMSKQLFVHTHYAFYDNRENCFTSLTQSRCPFSAATIKAVLSSASSQLKEHVFSVLDSVGSSI